MLSEIRWENICVGDRCKSAIGNMGIITQKYLSNGLQEWDEDAKIIKIEWENGNISEQPHYLMNKVTYMEM